MVKGKVQVKAGGGLLTYTAPNAKVFFEDELLFKEKRSFFNMSPSPRRAGYKCDKCRMIMFRY